MAEEESFWECKDCQQENTEADTECCACGEPKPASRFAGYKVGLVTEVEAIPKTKLRAVKISLGGDETITVVTNAKNVDAAGIRVVVATIGAKIEVDGEEVEVKKTTVGGRKSEGMICDGQMLGWKGGGAGAAAILPESFELGAPPPPTRPRLA